MRFLILAATLLPASATAAPPQPARPGQARAPAAKLDCASAWKVRPADAPDKPKAQRLGELPPGNLLLSVMRQVDGCPEPVIVRYGYGATRPERDSGRRR